MIDGCWGVGKETIGNLLMNSLPRVIIIAVIYDLWVCLCRSVTMNCGHDAKFTNLSLKSHSWNFSH